MTDMRFIIKLFEVSKVCIVKHHNRIADLAWWLSCKNVTWFCRLKTYLYNLAYPSEMPDVAKLAIHLSVDKLTYWLSDW